MMDPIIQILKRIDEGHRFLVASHENPDGDAIASTLALTNFLKGMGKDAVAYNRDGCPPMFDFLAGSESVVSDLNGLDPFDVGFVLDAGELHRAGSHLSDDCRVLINIDHHPHSEMFGEVQFLDESACATGALIYRLIKASGSSIQRPIATCIYTAILSDTGSFRYSNANPEAFQIAAEMVALGVVPWDVATGLYENQAEGRLHLLGRALGSLTLSPCGRIASISVTSEMMEETGTGPEHTDGFVNYPRSIHGVEVALFFRQIGEASFKVGFRSKGTVDVGALARELGGGGHHNAAGAMVNGQFKTVQAAVMERVGELLDSSEIKKSGS